MGRVRFERTTLGLRVPHNKPQRTATNSEHAANQQFHGVTRCSEMRPLAASAYARGNARLLCRS